MATKKKPIDTKKPRITREERTRLKNERIAAEQAEAMRLFNNIKHALGGGRPSQCSEWLSAGRAAFQEGAGVHRAPRQLRHSAATAKGMGRLLPVVGYQP